MMVDINKMYQTRDGRAVRILCVDGPDKGCPVIGLVEGLPLDPLYWKADGQARRPETDLFPVDTPEPVSTETWAVDWKGLLKPVSISTKHEGWIVVFSDYAPNYFYDYFFHSEREAANWLHGDTRKGWVAYVTWED